MATKKTPQERERRRVQRREEARRRAKKIREIERLRREEMFTLHAAMRRVGFVVPHTTYDYLKQRLDREGEIGLVDKRTRGRSPKVTPEVRGFIVGVGESEPRTPAGDFCPRIRERFQVDLSRRVVQQVLNEAGLARPRGTPGHAVRCERIEGLGLQIVKVVDERIGCTQALAQTIKEQVRSLPAPPRPIPVDRRGRRDDGTFTSAYNAPRPRRDPKVGAVFESVDVKCVEKDPTRLQLRRSSLETIQNKLLCVMALPMVSDDGRLDGATDPRGLLLGGFGGLPYMAETLRKFVGGLKYAKVSTPLMECHAKFWAAHMKECLGVEPTALVVYIDGAGKPLWTRYFHKSGKVSRVGRVMPCLESVLLCAGPGVPLYVRTFCGHAPLIKHVVPTIERVEEAIGLGQFSRLTVIDREANAYELLRKLDSSDPRRVFVTPMTRWQLDEDLSRIEGLNSFHPYREGDWIGEGTISLHNSKNRQDPPLSLRAIVVEQRGKGTFVGFVTNAPVDDLTDAELADTYYSRWPCQEGVIRDLNGGTSFGVVHGFGKSCVVNVSVVTEIEKLGAHVAKLQERKPSALDKQARAKGAAHQAGVLQRRLQRRHSAATANVSRLELGDKTHTKGYRDAKHKQRELDIALREATLTLREADHTQTVASTKVASIQQTIERETSKKADLESRREIYLTDVELDQTYSVLSFTWLVLIWTALHLFFNGLRMELRTFMSQILALPGYRLTTATTETIRLIANPRNRALMQSLEEACERINALKHRRGTRLVRFELVWESEPPGPP